MCAVNLCDNVSVVSNAPLVKDIIAIDSGSVHIEWNIPTDIKGVLSFYTIFYSIENGPERSLMVPFNGQDVSHSHIE